MTGYPIADGKSTERIGATEGGIGISLQGAARSLADTGRIPASGNVKKTAGIQRGAGCRAAIVDVQMAARIHDGVRGRAAVIDVNHRRIITVK